MITRTTWKLEPNPVGSSPIPNKHTSGIWLKEVGHPSHQAHRTRPSLLNKSQNFMLLGFSDSDWGGSVDDMKSTSGYCFSLGS